jgi:dinuclear metal center YbgI/SA1388 family protein
MALVRQLIDAMDRLAPLRFAEPWDNVGLLVGSPDQDLGEGGVPGGPPRPPRPEGTVLLCIDMIEPVVEEAIHTRCGAILAYHPPIFHAIKRLAPETGRERALLRAIRAGLAICSPHTALDSAPGGITDWLADGLLDRKGIVKADRRALSFRIERETTQEVKIVTFVPEEKADDMRAALASAGAGLIGNYEVCSFASPGTGTFYGKDGSKPAVGSSGRLERVSELRLEMVCSKKALALAIATLRQLHPYEEPAIDVYELVGKPERSAGLGRRLVLDQPATLAKLADRLKTHLSIEAVKVAAAPGHQIDQTPLTYVGVCPGAGASLAPVALAEACQVYITGEMTHHEVMAMLHAGMSVILAGHTNTERGYLPRLAERLTENLPGVRFLVSEADRSPFVFR